MATVISPMLATLSLISALMVGQSAGPAGVGSATLPKEVKSLGDVYALHRANKAPEYLKSVVLLTVRTPDNIGASRLETLIGPERVMFKMNDLEGTAVAIAGTSEEYWVVNHKENVYYQVPLGQPLTTDQLKEYLFTQLNQGMSQEVNKNDDNPTEFAMQFDDSGMPTVTFAEPLKLESSKDKDGGKEFMFRGLIKDQEIVATVTTDKDKRVTMAHYDIFVEGFVVTISLEQVYRSTDVVGRELFAFPAESVKGYKKGGDEGSGDGGLR